MNIETRFELVADLQLVGTLQPAFQGEAVQPAPTYDITLVGRMVSVVQNGHTIIDNNEIPGITGGALDSQEELPGPIYLQGSEKGRVAFRSIVLTPPE